MTLRANFWCAPRPQEEELAVALSQGFPGQLRIVDRGSKRSPPADVDFVARLRQFRVGDPLVPKVYLDKGWFTRNKGRAEGLGERTETWGRKAYWAWRVSVNDFEPVRWLESDRYGPERWGDAVPFLPWRENGGPVVVVGTSPLYHGWAGDKYEQQEWAEETVERLREITKRRIIWRPKMMSNGHEDRGMNERGIKKIVGSDFSWGERFTEPMKGAWCAVTVQSAGCLDAMMLGIPSIVLGPGVVAPISSRTLEEVENPRLASDRERRQLLWNLAHWRYTLQEIADGRLWDFVKDKLDVR